MSAQALAQVLLGEDDETFKTKEEIAHLMKVIAKQPDVITVEKIRLAAVKSRLRHVDIKRALGLKLE